MANEVMFTLKIAKSKLMQDTKKPKLLDSIVAGINEDLANIVNVFVSNIKAAARKCA